MTRDEALVLMTDHTPSESLQKHMLAVETCMRGYARHLGEDEEAWGIAGLLHDFDYEQHPDEHPKWGMERLREMGESEELIRAIASHAPERTGVEPESTMERHLFACDELAGFITACCYVRPSRSVLDLEVKSVKKKLKTAAFAAGVSRDDVTKGAELIGADLDDHIARMIEFMRADAEHLGLAGSA